MNTQQPAMLPVWRTILLLLAVMLMAAGTAGCVHRVATSWRLANNVLVPPGVSRPTVTKQTVKAEPGAPAACPPGVRARRKQILVKVTRDRLSKQQPGWLTGWAENLEAQGCIAPGEAVPLAERIAQSLPLEMNAPFHLLYPDDKETGIVEIGPHVRLQVNSPIMVQGAAPDAPIIESSTATVSGDTVKGISVDIQTRFTANLVGYETAWYSAQSKSHSPGVSIAPVSTERHINGETERVPLPIHDYFQALSSSSFYGLFYKGGETAFTALIVGAATRADLDRRMNQLGTGIASCETLNNEICAAVPKRVAINPMVLVTVNGTEMPLPWGATLGAAIGAGGGRQPRTLLPQLSVFKPYAGRMAPVEFDPADPAILNMILMGGETISWK